eukprot:917437-Alexandrium_andersonii.AAC.1
MGEITLTRQLGAPLRGAQNCYMKASPPIVRCPSGGGPERALRGLGGGALTSLRGVPAIGRWPVLRLTQTSYDLADFL